MNRASVVFVGLLSLRASVASAAAVDGIAQAAPPAVAPVPSSVEHDDPGADHALLAPTALTQPAGTIAVSLYEIIGAGLTYGITDRLQVSASGTAPIDNDARAWANLKYQVLRLERTRLALYGGLMYHQGYKPYDPAYPQKNIPGTYNREEERLSSPFAGAAVTQCLTEDCHSSLTGGAATIVNFRPDKTSAEWYLGASLLLRMSTHTKLVFELAGTFSQISDQLGQVQRYVPAAGLRMFWQHLSGDVGFLFLPEVKGDSLNAYFPVPYISVSARF